MFRSLGELCVHRAALVHGSPDEGVTSNGLCNASVTANFAQLSRCNGVTGGIAVFLDDAEIQRRLPSEDFRIDEEREKAGAPGTIRTCDPCLRRAVLYPLSYGCFAARKLAKVAGMRKSCAFAAWRGTTSCAI